MTAHAEHSGAQESAALQAALDQGSFTEAVELLVKGPLENLTDRVEQHIDVALSPLQELGRQQASTAQAAEDLQEQSRRIAEQLSTLARRVDRIEAEVQPGGQVQEALTRATNDLDTALRQLTTVAAALERIHHERRRDQRTTLILAGVFGVIAAILTVLVILD